MVAGMNNGSIYNEETKTTEADEVSASGSNSLVSCGVTDRKGNHCDGSPKHFIKLDDGIVKVLCDQCYDSWQKGQWKR